MDEKEKYAQDWNNSAEHFYINNDYDLLAQRVSEYKTVLEIGCGTGQSTLSLILAGHKVIAVDQNPFCIRKAKELISSKVSDANKLVHFYQGDITDCDFCCNTISNLSYDAVLCWNIGTHWDRAKIKDVLPKMLEYGLTECQIREDLSSSYSEYLVWNACSIAKRKNCAVHIVDRSGVVFNEKDYSYYSDLKEEFGFTRFCISSFVSSSLSKGGVLLVTDGHINNEEIIPICFISVLME